jgi:hypothetical protein
MCWRCASRFEPVCSRSFLRCAEVEILAQYLLKTRGDTSSCACAHAAIRPHNHDVKSSLGLTWEDKVRGPEWNHGHGQFQAAIPISRDTSRNDGVCSDRIASGRLRDAQGCAGKSRQSPDVARQASAKLIPFCRPAAFARKKHESRTTSESSSANAAGRANPHNQKPVAADLTVCAVTGRHSPAGNLSAESACSTC